MSLAVPSTISVIEEFYGEQLCSQLLKTIRNTPYDQLLELADRMVKYNRSLENALQRRVSTLGGPVSQSFEQFSRDQIFCWDDLYLDKHKTYPVTESRSLKHAILYTERFMLPDYSLDWAEEFLFLEDIGQVDDREAAGLKLEARIRGLALIAPLVRRGIIILAASCENFDLGQWDRRYSLGFRCRLDERSYTNIFWEDPYLAWWLVNSAIGVEPWELEALDLHRSEDFQEAASYFLMRERDNSDFQDGLPNLLISAYGAHVSRSSVQDALMLNRTYREAKLVPMTSSAVGRMHLTRSAKVALDGIMASDVSQHDAVIAASKYRLPPVSNVSIDDLIRLRLQEDIYEDVRSCLTNLVASVENYKAVGDYHSYELELRTVAEDFVRPVYDNLNARRRKEKLAGVLAGYAVGSVIAMSFNGIASLLTGPAALATRHVSKAAGNVGKRRATRRFNPQSRELDIGCSLLISVLNDAC